MRVSTIDERFADFLSRPTLNRWHGVRDLLILRTDFDPYGRPWHRLESAFGAENYAEVLRLAVPLTRSGCLSPHYHFLVGASAWETGDTETAEYQRECSSICLQSILDSGDGTDGDPYLTTYPSDGYDVLRAVNVEPVGQQLVDQDGRWCDVLATADGDEYWFDVTHLLIRDNHRKAHLHLQQSPPVESRPS